MSSVARSFVDLAARDASGDSRPAREEALRRDRAVVDAILAGDEAAFLSLVMRWHDPMARLARCYVGGDAAEEVARFAWREVLEGLARWQPRTSLAAFVFGVVASRARSRADRESPEGPSAGAAETDPSEPGTTPALQRGAGGWAEELASAGELVALQRAAETLPPMQQAVFTLRDVVGCSSAEASEVLGVSEVEARALLHRARARLRTAMALHLRLRDETSLGAAGEAR